MVSAQPAKNAPMRMLVAVDGSPSSTAAVQFVASRLAFNGAPPHIDLVNVQTPIPAYPARVAGGATVRAYHASQSKRILLPAQGVLEKSGLAVARRCIIGVPGVALGRLAAKGSDLIVMGAHGRTATAGLVFGSVTNTVLAACKTPVLIVRAPLRRRSKPSVGGLHVGIAIDGSRYGAAAIRYVLKHVHLFGPSPTLSLIRVVPDLLSVYVPGLAQMPTPMFSPEQAADSQRRAFEATLAPARRLFARAGLAAAEIPLVSNGPGDALAAYATERKLDLLVMGSHGYGALKSLLLGSVTTRVAAKCKTPLLLIRAP